MWQPHGATLALRIVTGKQLAHARLRRQCAKHLEIVSCGFAHVIQAAGQPCQFILGGSHALQLDAQGVGPAQLLLIALEIGGQVFGRRQPGIQCYNHRLPGFIIGYGYGLIARPD